MDSKLKNKPTRTKACKHGKYCDKRFTCYYAHNIHEFYPNPCDNGKMCKTSQCPYYHTEDDIPKLWKKSVERESINPRTDYPELYNQSPIIDNSFPDYISLDVQNSDSNKKRKLEKIPQESSTFNIRKFSITVNGEDLLKIISLLTTNGIQTLGVAEILQSK